ncbi:unnamed protein product [Dovyalis caffra]|uniref:Uncharacterized protein n=1 Tax=Dovyalis caffra TaxID=77055 RepID=A0AAV1SCE8_9ROSI|nr:unnamed protein product [Dovyalis caffra]
MNSLDGITMTGWKNLKQRLSFKGLGCCGGTSWSSTTPAMPFIDIEEEEDDQEVEEEPVMQNQAQRAAAAAPGVGMNLAMALAAERNLRPSNVKTLMRLIEETDGVDWRNKNNSDKSTRDEDQEQKREEETDWVCCVCMERNKGFVPEKCGSIEDRVLSATAPFSTSLISFSNQQQHSMFGRTRVA